MGLDHGLAMAQAVEMSGFSRVVCERRIVFRQVNLEPMVWLAFSSPIEPGTTEPTCATADLCWRRMHSMPYGVQVLTSAHLERASDLQDRQVSTLSGDASSWRHATWETGTASPPHLLEKARADVGDMILTRETIDNARLIREGDVTSLKRPGESNAARRPVRETSWGRFLWVVIDSPAPSRQGS